MQIHINDGLYQQLSDYAARMHVKIDKLVETEMTKLLKNHSSEKPFTPHPSWPKGMFTPYNDDRFPDIHELRADLIEQQPVEL